jgi:polysaccharide deacetylase family protein (PEP-CTERM system associated)
VGEARPDLILSFDLEDWHQLVHRDLGDPDWDRRHEAFERQVASVLALLDELGVAATFFVLGVCARTYPDAVREIAARGHELACHGYAHERVPAQTADAFRADVIHSIDLIGELGGRTPAGYRAPAFSITRACAWAYEMLGELGFRYDSSQYDSPRIRGRLAGIPSEPYRLELASGKSLVEFPVAVARVGGRALPVGGGTYWRALPPALLFRALRAAASQSPAPVLYFHPYELDPRPLRAEVPPGASASQRLRAARYDLYWNARRPRIARLLRRAAREFRLLTYESYLAAAGGAERAGAKTLSGEGVVV